MLVECTDLSKLLSEYHRDYREKECGAVPEGYGPFASITYYRDRYYKYTKEGYDWETVIYYSDTAFDPDNYNEKSIKKESKLAFV